ncbi:putative metallopeptidase [Nitrolancea hollandica]|uniref:Putative phage metallopeptidase domain-containing protein n=1 Tax=Nitrolancea hollandica Lb TaxID=1129897 RepID=I4EG06_9BACT|nr:putative metallopeptidase [Nitrolancea hollandica]CCF83618.1 hypothetical protein NITHO_2510016 [Nitrolancea hollandica Lb]
MTIDLSQQIQTTFVTDGNPDMPYRIPTSLAFGEGDEAVEFLHASDLAAIGNALIERDPQRFGHLASFHIAYLWRAKGGTPGGKPKFGMCQRPSGLLKFFSGVDFVVWLAADNCREHGLSNYQIEALVYHELLHAGVTDDFKPTIWPHDFQAFRAEIETYGAWQTDLQLAQRSFEQLRLNLN